MINVLLVVLDAARDALWMRTFMLLRWLWVRLGPHSRVIDWYGYRLLRRM
ncbi:MAG TPA: hypothetical protein VD932_03730 [Aquabacterium sp.]|nr:hypothetical protein [Aquabacterium sp.]